jgi:hypothetical protein
METTPCVSHFWWRKHNSPFSTVVRLINPTARDIMAAIFHLQFWVGSQRKKLSTTPPLIVQKQKLTVTLRRNKSVVEHARTKTKLQMHLLYVSG